MTLDVCFNDSFLGVLMQHNGSSKSVVLLDLFLDVGDLSDGVFSDSRKAAINALHNDIWLGGEDIWDDEFWTQNINDLNRIREHATRGGKLRVWYSMSVCDMCGFMYLMSELQDISCDLTGICLQACPNWLAYTDGGWGKIFPNDVDEFLGYERTILEREKSLYAKQWTDLSKQHWELRTFLNGAVTGVPIDFFDNLLLSFVPDGEFQMMRVLGQVIASTSGGPQYYFWHMRLTQLLHTEQFELTQDHSSREDDNPPIYRMWFRRRVSE